MIRRVAGAALFVMAGVVSINITRSKALRVDP
jgi:hypothetical protein